jgi:hypothetical protein
MLLNEGAVNDYLKSITNEEDRNTVKGKLPEFCITRGKIGGDGTASRGATRRQKEAIKTKGLVTEKRQR